MAKIVYPTEVRTDVDYSNVSSGALMYILANGSRVLAGHLGNKMYNARTEPTPHELTLIPKPYNYQEIYTALVKRNIREKRIGPTNVMKAVISQGYEVESDGHGVQINFGEDCKVSMPLTLGVPVVDKDAAEVLTAKLRLDVPVTTALEITAAAMITDSIKIVNSQVQPRMMPAGVLVLSKEAEYREGQFVAAVTTYMGDALRGASDDKLINVKGRTMAARCHDIFSDHNTEQPFAGLLKTVIDLGMAAGIPQIISKIGDYDGSSVMYYHKVLESTRALRGSDKTDNTASGVSNYLPYDLDRDMVKVMQRITDVINIISVTGAEFINIVGDDVSKYVTSLMLAKRIGTLKKIGLVSPHKYGWKEVEIIKLDALTNQNFKVSEFVSENHDYVIVQFDGSKLTLNVDFKESVNIDLSEVRAKKYNSVHNTVQLGPVVGDASSATFLPSCLVHNLIGYYFSSDIKLNMPVYAMMDYLQLTVKANYIKTYPTRVNRRLFHYIRENKTLGFLGINPAVMNGVSKKLASQAITLFNGSAFDLGAMISEYNQAAHDRLAQAAITVLQQENSSAAATVAVAQTAASVGTGNSMVVDVVFE